MFQSIVGEKQKDARKIQWQSSHQQAREAEPLLGHAYGNQALLRVARNGGMPPVTPFRPSQSIMLQRKCACNQTSKNVLEEGIQPKLAIDSPSDALEQEADRIADQVLRMPEHPSTSLPLSLSPVRDAKPQRKCAKCEEEEEKMLQTKPAHTGGTLDATTAARVAERGGMPLSNDVRSYFEPRFGHDFSHVRVHVGGEAADGARAISARAYTLGHDIVFGAGEYVPGTLEGKRLLAHELAHTLQQGPASIRRQLMNPADENKAPGNLGPSVSELPQPPMGGLTYKKGQLYWWGKNLGLPSPLPSDTPEIPLDPRKIPGEVKQDTDKRKKADCAPYPTHPYPGNSDAYLGQCCKSFVESAANCCPLERLSRNGGCCGPNQTAKPDKCEDITLPQGWTPKLPNYAPNVPVPQPAPSPQPLALDLSAGVIDDFDINSASINTRQEAKLQAVRDRVKLNCEVCPNTSIDVVGYADKPGAEDYNMKLGQNRAENVTLLLKMDLMRAGVMSSVMIFPRSEGSGQASAATDAGGRPQYNSADRKVEVILHALCPPIGSTAPQKSFGFPNTNLPSTSNAAF